MTSTAAVELGTRPERDQTRLVWCSQVPWLAVTISSFGLLVVTLSDDHARGQAALTSIWYWIGIAIIFGTPLVPILLWRSISRGYCIAAVLATSTLLFLTNVVQSPTSFVFQDEFGWLRAVRNIAATGHLFAHNPIVPNYASYPALSIVVTAIQELGRTSTFVAGTLLIGIIKVMAAGALLSLLYRLVGNYRAAACGAFIYMSNPTYLQFDSLFSYESMAISLGIILIWMLTWAVGASQWRRCVPVLPVAACLVVAHHLVTYFVLTLLLGWIVAGTVLRRVRKDEEGSRRLIPVGVTFAVMSV